MARFNTFSQRPSTENVTANQSHKQGVLEVMIKRISPPKAFHCTSSERTKSFGTILLCRAKYLPKIFGKELRAVAANAVIVLI